jgi:hypothetical protein
MRYQKFSRRQLRVENRGSYIPPKRLQTHTRLHTVTNQNIVIFIHIVDEIKFSSGNLGHGTEEAELYTTLTEVKQNEN